MGEDAAALVDLERLLDRVIPEFLVVQLTFEVGLINSFVAAAQGSGRQAVEDRMVVVVAMGSRLGSEGRPPLADRITEEWQKISCWLSWEKVLSPKVL